MVKSIYRKISIHPVQHMLSSSVRKGIFSLFYPFVNKYKSNSCIGNRNRTIGFNSAKVSVVPRLKHSVLENGNR